MRDKDGMRWEGERGRGREGERERERDTAAEFIAHVRIVLPSVLGLLLLNQFFSLTEGNPLSLVNQFHQGHQSTKPKALYSVQISV